MTYEVRRYFQSAADDPGVVVGAVETGSRAAVAGLKPYEIITAVNGAPVRSAEGFEEAVAAGGEVSLTVKRMFQSRVVQVVMEPRESEAPDGGEGD
jgi:S1-C subfamily serine protease